jgi:hypothetical protein
MKKRDFLVPVAVAVTALGAPTAGTPTAAESNQQVQTVSTAAVDPNDRKTTKPLLALPKGTHSGEIVLAAHSSHSSHASHASHSSHYSSSPYVGSDGGYAGGDSGPSDYTDPYDDGPTSDYNAYPYTPTTELPTTTSTSTTIATTTSTSELPTTTTSAVAPAVQDASASRNNVDAGVGATVVGVAAVAGGGAWWRRRKKKAQP